MKNYYLYFIIGYVIFTIVTGHWFIENTLGYMENYKLNCDDSFIIPNISYITPKDKSYYFDNPDASCEKLYFLSYFLGGLTLFVIGTGVFVLTRFFMTTEISVVLRKRR